MILESIISSYYFAHRFDYSKLCFYYQSIVQFHSTNSFLNIHVLPNFE